MLKEWRACECVHTCVEQAGRAERNLHHLKPDPAEDVVDLIAAEPPERRRGEEDAGAESPLAIFTISLLSSRSSFSFSIRSR